MKIQNMLNYNYREQSTQPLGTISLTVPDQAMSVREILNRYARGLPLGGSKAEIWDGEDEYIPDPRTLDLSEIEDLKNEATDLFKTVNDQKAKSEKAKLKKQILAEIAAENPNDGLPLPPRGIQPEPAKQPSAGEKN